jgi:galactokinase
MDIQELSTLFQTQFGYAPSFVARAPGRVNLIGEHTDYNGGFVLPMAIDRDVTLVGAARRDKTVRVYSANFEQASAFSLDAVTHSPEQEWNNYVRGVADVLQKAGHTLHGFDATMFGNVPIASGLSSSAATEMATIEAFNAAGQPGGLGIDGVREAKFAQQAENQFVGVNCGIMDQFISSLGQQGQALFIDCRSLEYQLVPMPKGVTVLVVDTQAPRTLAGSAYNERRAQCEEAARIFGVSLLRDVSVSEFEQHKGELPPLVATRAAHVIYENQRVLDAVQALHNGDVAAFGHLMNQSHDSLRDLYAVSSKELDAVVDIARATPGVLGARMTGAGFGGCAIALVSDANVSELKDAVEREYPIRTGRAPRVYACVPSAGAGWKLL